MADFIGPSAPIGSEAKPDTPSAALSAALVSDAGAAITGSSQGAQTYYTQAKPGSAVVTSSTPFQTQVDNTKATIASSQHQPVIPPVAGQYNPAYDPNSDSNVAADTIAVNKADLDRRAALQAERDAEVARILGQSGTEQAKLEQTQKAETGSSTRNLLYLQQGGQSASAQAYLNSLEITHKNEMTALQSKYDQAIATAKNAYADKDFQLAQDMTKNAKDIRDEAIKRNQAFLDNTLKINTQIREDSTAAFNKQKETQAIAKDARDYATKTGITQPFYELGGQLFSTADGSMINLVEDFTAAGGKPDFSNVFVVQPNDNKSYAGGALGEFQYLVDQGQYKPGEFQKYLNQKKSDAVAIAAAGRGPSVHDQVLEEKNQTKQAVNDMDAKLAARIGKNDTFVSPQDWAYYRNLWVKAGNDVSDFDSKFLHYTNPGDKKDYIGIK